MYPGPRAINRRRQQPHESNRLNGRDTQERLHLMYAFGIPYQRGGPYGSRGEVPDPYMLGDPLKPEVGYREKELWL